MELARIDLTHPLYQQILAALDTRGGLLTGDVANKVTPQLGHSRRTHSHAIRSLLLLLKAAGVVRELDGEKPSCWIKVDTPAPEQRQLT